MNPPGLIARDIVSPATIQDSGRRGWRRWGVSASGAMDIEALAAANALVGNDWQEAAVEFAFQGGEWDITAHSCRLAVTGGRFAVFVDDQPAPPYCALVLCRGQRLRIGGTRDAVWGYLAVQGGFGLPETLGSRSTQLRASIGGVEGRMIRRDDALTLSHDRVTHTQLRRLPPPVRADTPDIRILLGPQDDHFTQETLDTFLSATWEVSNRIDRMGYHLNGPTLVHGEKGANIVSDGTVPGSIQIPALGHPIVLMRDCQPTGGYPKIATMLSCDIGRLAQVRPGGKLHFRLVSRDDAGQIQRDFLNHLAGLEHAASHPSGRFVGQRGGFEALLVEAAQ